MAKSKIEWCDLTWNPTTGCLNNCPYCYARRMMKRLVKMQPGVYPNGFEPTFHPSRLDYPGTIKKSKRIFVGSMTDLWGEGIAPEWRGQIYDACNRAPSHKFIFLTKNPRKLIYPQETLFFGLPNHFFGWTITSHADISVLTNTSPNIPRNWFINFEPLLNRVWNIPYQAADKCKWFIIGCQTSAGRPVNVPKREWVEEIIQFAQRNQIPIFIKQNLLKAIPELPRLQEFPEGLR